MKSKSWSEIKDSRAEDWSYSVRPEETYLGWSIMNQIRTKHLPDTPNPDKIDNDENLEKKYFSWVLVPGSTKPNTNWYLYWYPKTIIACKSLTYRLLQYWVVEVPGIEPGSEMTNHQASTCLVALYNLAWRVAGQQGCLQARPDQVSDNATDRDVILSCLGLAPSKGSWQENRQEDGMALLGSHSILSIVSIYIYSATDFFTRIRDGNSACNLWLRSPRRSHVTPCSGIASDET